MRTRSGWALSVLGVLVAILGAAAMVLLGPDSRFTTGPHAIETDDIAVVTAPTAIRWADVQVDVLAEVPVRKPIFIGVGNAVDVQDFVGRTQRLEVTTFRRPFDLETREVKGTANLPGAPTSLDWWIDSAAGLGGASISTQLPDQTVSIAILSVGSSNLSGLEVTLAYGVKGGFAKGAAVLLLGLALTVLGVAVRRGGPWSDDEDDDVVDLDDDAGVEEEVVYVMIDDDGVEHEISAEEAAELDVVEVEEVIELVGPEPEPEPEPEPSPSLNRHPRASGSCTSTSTRTASSTRWARTSWRSSRSWTRRTTDEALGARRGLVGGAVGVRRPPRSQRPDARQGRCR